MEPDRKNARSLTTIIGTLAVVLLLAVGFALFKSCQVEPGQDAQGEQIAPPDDGPGPDGAPGVAQPGVPE